MKNHIISVLDWNNKADHQWKEYCEECQKNNLPPQRRSNFNCFMKFPYKKGFVVPGNYPLYYSTKLKALKTLGLA